MHGLPRIIHFLPVFSIKNHDSANLTSKTSKREVDIYYLSRKYMIAFDHLREAMRKFRTSRVMKAKINEELSMELQA
jgi:predicted DNA-binding transcriptional regulator YafY